VAVVVVVVVAKAAVVVAVWCSNYWADKGDPPTAVVSPYTLQWAALQHIGVVPHYVFLNSATVDVVVVILQSATYQCYWCLTTRVFVALLLWDFQESLLTFGFDFASLRHQRQPAGTQRDIQIYVNTSSVLKAKKDTTKGRFFHRKLNEL